MGSDSQQRDELSSATNFVAAVQRLAPELARRLREGHRQRVREWGFTLTTDGRWLAKAKSVDASGARPVIYWGSGQNSGEALKALNKALVNGWEREDKFPGQHWAR